MSQQKIALIAAPGANTRALALAVARSAPVPVDVLIEDTGPEMTSTLSGDRPHLDRGHPDDPTGWCRAARRRGKTSRRKLFRA